MVAKLAPFFAGERSYLVGMNAAYVNPVQFKERIAGGKRLLIRAVKNLAGLLEILQKGARGLVPIVEVSRQYFWTTRAATAANEVVDLLVLYAASFVKKI